MINYDLDFSSIMPSMVESLIASFGWEKKKSFPSRVNVWHYKSQNEAIWVPQQSIFSDYEDCIKKIIKQLSARHELSEVEITEQLKQYYYHKDLMKIRVISDDVNDGKIQYNDGTDIYNSLKEIIKGSMRAVSGITKANKDLFNTDCSLGQTDIGSYIVNIYCPIIETPDDHEQSQLPSIGSSGIGRQINQKTFKRLEYINNLLSSINNDVNDNVVAALVEQGFTKKECQAVENLFGSKGHRDWEIKFIWSKVCKHDTTTSIVRFDHQKSTAAHKLVKKISSLGESKSKVTLQGRILGLERDYNDQLGSVKFITEIEGKDRKVTVHLNESDFKVAHSANDIRSLVSVTGELTETQAGKRKYYQIHDINKFTLYSPPENLQLDIKH